eukprot:TRINITY_DN1263_c0_g1_i1.p1 TRINITY_DN1263_c0_g1~~TRINITY_DN1263_c0_g1_i1.p1  ORF type:complete len:662 (+),score=197.84 TRINITY_DN1263_c0_g1_i1:168-2153(+)
MSTPVDPSTAPTGATAAPADAHDAAVPGAPASEAPVPAEGESKAAMKKRLKAEAAAARKVTNAEKKKDQPAPEKKVVAPRAAAAPTQSLLESRALALPADRFHLQHVAVRDLLDRPDEFVGKTVSVAGWVRSIRQQQTQTFIAVNDGSCRRDAQILIPAADVPRILPHNAAGAAGAADVAAPAGGDSVGVVTGASIVAVGNVVRSLGTAQPVDVVPSQPITIAGGIGAGYPLAKAGLPLEFLRQFPHLRVRTQSLAAAARIRSTAAQAVHAFFSERAFHYVHTPIITAADCEGAGEMFAVTTILPRPSAAEVAGVVEPSGAGAAAGAVAPAKTVSVDYSKDFFRRAAFLTVSGQLNVETYCAGLGKVYTFGPTFRAELSDTSRHLAEFWMIEPEVSFCAVTDVMDLAEDFVRRVVAAVLQTRRHDIEQLDKLAARLQQEASKEKGAGKSKDAKDAKDAKDVPAARARGVGAEGLVGGLVRLVELPFRRLAYSDAVVILSTKDALAFHGVPITWGEDLHAYHERYLVEVWAENTPVFVVDWPAKIKSFYMRLNDAGMTSVPTEHAPPAGEATVQAFDLLSPMVGELIGGSQREERAAVLDSVLAARGMDRGPLDWYLELRQHGTAPHGGFGLGFERLLMLLTGLQNIRDVVPFPRFPYHCVG